MLGKPPDLEDLIVFGQPLDFEEAIVLGQMLVVGKPSDLETIVLGHLFAFGKTTVQMLRQATVVMLSY